MKRILLTAINLVIAMGFYAQSNVVEIEYFLDSDLGFGMNNGIIALATPDIDITEVVMANIPSSTSVGYHKLYFRTRDASGQWSHTTRKHIEVVASSTENNLLMGEYFIDEDPQFGTSTTTFEINPQTEDVQQAFEAQILANETLGYHKLYGRVMDSNGNWSHTFRRHIQVYLNPETNVVEIEYFIVDEFDQQFGNNNVVSIAEPAEDGTWEFNVMDYPQGEYNNIASMPTVLFVRVKDSNNLWSITTTLDEIVETMSLSDELFGVVNVSPNPFRNTIEISTTRAIALEQTKVYDITGKQVYQSSEDLRTIDLSHLQSGIYILKLTTESEQASFKIVKQ